MSGTSQWEQIEALFHAALEHKPEERDDYLAHNCTNSDILIEVKRLLAEDASSGGVLDSSSSGFARLMKELARPEPEESLVGKSVGPYKILEVLGQGGMGKVYLAEDIRLGRKVALKFLSNGIASRSDGLRRFMTEARATSALNHPNIVTIHDIGREGGVSYIAVEYIEGETLRQRMQRPLSTLEALRIVIQVARALAAAHGSGVIHRDIKPENIMIRTDGIVKVVDFGLAKLTRSELFSVGQTANSVDAPSTIPGAVLGTVLYMSPEQASGQELDARTDVFTLAVVLYEILAGHKPFVGDNLPAFLDCLISQEPEPIPDLDHNIRKYLQPILERAMAKERAARYQNAGELLGDLEAATQRIESSEIARRAADAARPRATKYSGKSPQAAPLRSKDTARQTGRLTSKRIRNGSLAAAAIILIALVAFIVHERRLRAPSPVGYADLKTEKITSSGDVQAVAVSSANHLVAYSTQDENGASIWIKPAPSGTELRVVGPGRFQVAGLTFSPDSTQIYYVAIPQSHGIGALFRVPVRGGSPTKVKDGVSSRIAFSPDGSQFAFVRTGIRQLVIINADGTGERTVATLGQSEIWRDPAWSPDGKTIACGIASDELTQQYLAAIAVNNGSISRIGSDNWVRVTDEAWVQDGSGLVMTAADRTSQILQVWFISYPGGAARRITNDDYDYHGASLDPADKSILSVRSVSATDIWVMNAGEQKTAHRIPYPSRDSQAVYVAWTADARRIVYSTGLRTTHDIWIMDASGENQRQLTSGPGLKEYPCVSPDNKYIVFASDAGGSMAIWRMNLDGSNQVQLSQGNGVFSPPQCTPDGNWVVYQSIDERLWKVPIEGGPPIQLTTYPASFPAPSLDGSEIACILGDQGAALGLVPANGGQPDRVVAVPAGQHIIMSQWSQRYGLTCLMGDSIRPLNVYRFPLGTGKPEQLSFFTDLQRPSSYNWDRDGRLVLSRTNEVLDVVRITGPGRSAQ